jgi:D-alanyl-D-alanine dipeptidase
MWRSHNQILNFYFKRVLALSLILNLLGCYTNDDKIQNKVGDKNVFSTNDAVSTIKKEKTIIDSLEQKLMDAGLVDMQIIDSTILVDLKYTTVNNFLNEDVYGHLTKAYLQKQVAIDLKKANDYLKSLDSNLTLLIYDAVRPRSVQQKMWDILELPINEKTKFVSNPKNGSIHNYGCAVDITIAYKDGTPLDMGADFDEIGEIAYPRLETQFLKTGELTQLQVEHRKLLRKVMKYGGFYNIQTEWWHFNRYNRQKAKEMFEIIE